MESDGKVPNKVWSREYSEDIQTNSHGRQSSSQGVMKSQSHLISYKMPKGYLFVQI